MPNENEEPGDWNPKRPNGPVEVRHSQIFHTFINGDLTKNGEPTPTLSKVMRQELYHNSSPEIYSRCQVNFTLNGIRTKSQTSLIWVSWPSTHRINSGPSVPPATIFGSPTDGSKWSTQGHVFGKDIAVGVIGTRSEKNYSSKTDFVNSKDNKYFQVFERQNISMS